MKSPTRIVSTQPRMQSIPLNSRAAKIIHDIFVDAVIAKSKLVTIDYSDIELRIMAHEKETEHDH